MVPVNCRRSTEAHYWFDRTKAQLVQLPKHKKDFTATQLEVSGALALLRLTSLHMFRFAWKALRYRMTASFRKSLALVVHHIMGLLGDI